MEFSGPEYVNVNGQTRIKLTISGSNGIMDQYFKGYYSTDNGSSWTTFIRRPEEGYYSGGNETRSFILEEFPDVIRKFPNTKTIKIKFEHHGDTLFIGWRQLDAKTKDVDLVANDITCPALSMKVAGAPLSNSYNMINITSLTPTFTPTTKLGASVKSYNFTVEGKGYTTAPYTSAVLTQGGWQTVTGTGTDSRGFTASVSEKIWVMANMPSLDVTGGYLNEAISCSITPANKDAYSRLILSRKVGNSYEDVKTVDVGTRAINTTETVTLIGNELTGTYEKFPSTVNVPIRVRLLTYTDAYATQIEENVKEITLKIPDNADTKPSITNVVTVGSPTLLNQSELYVKGKNGVKPTVTAGGKYNASIAKITWTVDGKTYDHGGASDFLTSFGTLAIKVTVTDTRGFSNSATKNISVSDYTKPLLGAADGKSKITIDRSTDGSIDYLYIAAKRNYTKLGGYNKSSMSFRAKPYKGEWGGINTILAEGATNDVYDQRTGYELNKELSYTVEITLTDSFGEKDIFTGGVATEAVFMDRAGSRGSIAFGGHVQADNAFEVYQDAYFHGGVVMYDEQNTAYILKIENGNLTITPAPNTYRRTKQ